MEDYKKQTLEGLEKALKNCLKCGTGQIKVPKMKFYFPNILSLITGVHACWQ
jgi:ferredoxin-like protein FixX